MFIALVGLLVLISCNAFSSKIPYLASDDGAVQKQLASLTLREKIGQLFVVAAASNLNQPTEQLATALRACPYNMDQEHVETMIEKYGVGGVIFLFKSDPVHQMALAQRFQQKSKLGLLMAQDCEWGLSMRLDTDPKKVVRYPRNMTLGAVRDESLIYQMGYEVGRQCAAIGIHMNCAPVCDVNNNPGNVVIHDRSFGDCPEKVARLAALYTRGLQDAGVIACAKHFPGHGDTTIDSHLDLPVIHHERDRLDAVELVPFKELMRQGVGAVMSAHLAVPALGRHEGIAATMSSAIITQELKNRLGFQGLVVTDGLGMEALTKRYRPGELELQAFLAGNDILLCPLDVPKAIDLIEQAIKDNRVTHADLDGRVAKILRAKAWARERQMQVNTGHDVHSFLIRPEAYALQKQLYRAAVTCAKSSELITYDAHLLQKSCVLCIGDLPERYFKEAVEKEGAVVCVVSAKLSEPEMNRCLQHAQDKEIMVVACGSLHKNVHAAFGISDNARKLVAECKKQGKKMVVVFFGTPYSAVYFQDTDLVLVAYEDAVPAQEAVVDVLRGRLKAEGNLSVALPKEHNVG